MKNNNLSDEVYVMVDGEFSGPIPPQNYLMSFGSVVFTLRDGFIGEFEVNLEPLPGAVMHQKTKPFWERNPEALAATQTNKQDPKTAMIKYDNHLRGVCHGRKAIFTEFPGFIDFMWIHWYYHNFLGHCPFGFSSVAMKTYIMAKEHWKYRDCAKRNFPQKWKNRKLKHTHKALDDARGQADMFIRVMCEHEDLPLPTGL